jgi:hypothetical protein
VTLMKALDQIEKLALKLPDADRAKLASHLLESLPTLLKDEDEGLGEAIRRDNELDGDAHQGISLEEFDAHVRQRKPE